LLAQGVFRAAQGAGEAICFGVDSIGVPYIKEAGVLLAFYTTGVIIFAYMAVSHISETQYFVGEEGVVIPQHVLKGQVPEKELKENKRQKDVYGGAVGSD
jgi:hypothetical protein